MATTGQPVFLKSRSSLVLSASAKDGSEVTAPALRMSAESSSASLRISGSRRLSANETVGSPRGGQSPRESRMLRENPHSWLTRLEKVVGGTVREAFFFEALSKRDTTPEPFDATLHKSPPRSPTIETFIESVRLVEAFLTLPDGTMIRSPKKSLTFCEAIESAALEWFRSRMSKEDEADSNLLSKGSSSSSLAEDEVETTLLSSTKKLSSRKSVKN